jgi:hypothetical protein
MQIQFFNKKMVILKLIVDLAHYVDWSGRRETPAGKAGQGRPRRRVMRRGGSRPTAESECLKWKSTCKFNRIKKINIIEAISLTPR